VLEVEQVLCVLDQRSHPGMEVRALEVGHNLKTLLPYRPEEERCGLMSQRSLVPCGTAWSEGNDGGGGVRGWWSAAHGAVWSYSVARCSECGRGGRRGARVVVRGSSMMAGMAGVRAVKW
jgi:hypothetical protein